jgi:hypothetical protein
MSHAAAGSASPATLTTGPLVCPLFPLAFLGDGYLYYCDYFENDCFDSPEPVVAFGTYALSPECPQNCFNANLSLQRTDQADTTAASSKFDGLLAPLPVRETLRIPPASGARRSKVFIDPDIQFIEFRDIKGTRKHAKVFAINLDPIGPGAEVKSCACQLRYAAFESEGPIDPELVVPLSCIALESDAVVGEGECHVYRGIYEPTLSTRIHLLVLTVRTPAER